ncbi:MAG: hypothetical protein H7X97_12970 [Opitutaceae bacterium]|nr:hypothetical protein [Verrucomicrobiales bacterium]
MTQACVALAESPEYQPVWNGNAPAAFATELAAVKTALTSTLALASQADAAATGAAQDKDVAETALEDAAYPLARALALHFKKAGNLTDRAKVDRSLSAIQKLSAQNLVSFTKQVRDLANMARLEQNATDRGVTEARITTLSAAITAYEQLINTPRTQIVNRSTLLRELETRTADLLEMLSDLDDLVVQFDTTDLGHRFVSAWTQTRTILDLGHRFDPPTPPDPNPAPTPTP